MCSQQSADAEWPEKVKHFDIKPVLEVQLPGDVVGI